MSKQHGHKGKSKFSDKDKGKRKSSGNARAHAPVKKKQQQKPSSNSGEIRLNKYIANSGICSRREADEHIAIGLVTVNGKVVTEMGYKVKLEDEVRYDGARI